ncbi:MAG: ATP-binding protein [Nitrospirae bacterium]|nr:ATP-binding protein [Nitrospirota bacterium]MBF0534764.1 ATP-binding protein [Nitrospirota bacterium]MBF0616438.1 ATP-binding protein [Nitrospirota bacterium]
MTKKGIKKLKIRRLKIINFKAIDFIEIEFPKPIIKNEPDVFVMGSINGLGKTSILEACTLLVLAITGGIKLRNRGPFEFPINFFDLLIRSGSDKAVIEADVEINNKVQLVSLTLHTNGKIDIDHPNAVSANKDGNVEMYDYFIHTLAGYSNEPLLFSYFMYFHSYRKVQEGRIPLGMIVDREERDEHIPRLRPFYRKPLKSIFKGEVLKAFIGGANLVETLDPKDSSAVLIKLNNLLKNYAKGTIEKLTADADSTVDFRVTPVNGGKSFAFDGLSSGQKEIISTLFLIWHYTQNSSAVVLIDEPELHLNHEWHRNFIGQLNIMAPNNQYIIATHSEDIADSVDKNRRIILRHS